MQVVEDARAGTELGNSCRPNACVVFGIGTRSVKRNIGEIIITASRNRKISEDNQRKSGEN
jgi:hypothetical protein